MYYEINSRPGFGENENNYFVVPVHDGVFGLEELCRYATQFTTLASADMKAANTVTAEAVADALASGKRVVLEGLGSFSLKLTADAELTGPDDKVGKKVRVKDVNFRPAKQLMTRLAEMSFQRAPYVKACQWDEQPTDHEERLAAYFREHDVLRRADVERLWQCRRTKACALLQIFCAKGLIRNAGTPRTPFYVAGDL